MEKMLYKSDTKYKYKIGKKLQFKFQSEQPNPKIINWWKSIIHNPNSAYADILLRAK